MSRKLAYKDRYTLYEQGVMFSGQTGSISSERILSPDGIETFVIQCTGDEFDALFSAAMVGTKLMWGAEGHGILWYLWKAGQVNLCQAIAECIEGGSLDGALSRYLSENGYMPSNPLYENADPSSIVGVNQTELATDDGCSNDVLFGQCSELTDYMNALCEDLAEQLDLLGQGSVVSEGIAALISYIPIVGKIADDVVGFAEWLFETAADLYFSGYTASLRDEIRCALFCIGKDNCSLKFSDVTAYLSSEAGINIEGQSIEQIAQQILNVGTGREVVFAFHALLVSVLEVGGSWFGVNQVNSFALAMALGANNPDSDWTILCSECPPPYDPCSLPIAVDFEDALPECAAIVSGYVFEISGNKVLRNNGVGTIWTRTRVDIPIVTQSLQVQFQFAWERTTTNSLPAQAIAYNAQNQQVGIAVQSSPCTANVFNTFNQTLNATDDIAYVICQWGVTFGSSHALYQDNIQVG